jgi:hypothetical protein
VASLFLCGGETATFCHKPARYTDPVTRLAILIVALLIGAAAPVRAWCEASCLAPAADAAKPHCPTHEPASDAPAMSAHETVDCPIIESARPATGKIALISATPAAPWNPAPQLADTATPRHSGPQAPRHLTRIPLRI